MLVPAVPDALEDTLRDLELLRTLAKRSARRLVDLVNKESNDDADEGVEQLKRQMQGTLLDVKDTLGQALQTVGVRDEEGHGGHGLGREELQSTLERYSHMLVQLVKDRLKPET